MQWVLPLLQGRCDQRYVWLFDHWLHEWRLRCCFLRNRLCAGFQRSLPVHDHRRHLSLCERHLARHESAWSDHSYSHSYSHSDSHSYSYSYSYSHSIAFAISAYAIFLFSLSLASFLRDGLLHSSLTFCVLAATACVDCPMSGMAMYWCTADGYCSGDSGVSCTGSVLTVNTATDCNSFTPSPAVSPSPSPQDQPTPTPQPGDSPSPASVPGDATPSPSQPANEPTPSPSQPAGRTASLDASFMLMAFVSLFLPLLRYSSVSPPPFLIILLVSFLRVVRDGRHGHVLVPR